MGVPSDLLVIGLGNPGAEYAGTRHNVGAETVELLAARLNSSLKLEKKERALLADLKIDGKKMSVAFPQTFMNDSGVSVRELVKRSGIESLEQLVVVHDELDLETGRLQVKLGGGIAGHNGLRSIVQHVKSQEFGRVRIGIGRPNGSGSDYVLKRPSKEDAVALALAREKAADAVEALLNLGAFEPVMNQFNR